MRVARLYDVGDVRVEEMERPVPGPQELLVRTLACGICTGEIMPWYMRRKAPLVPGHEPVGVIEEVGGRLDRFRPGDRVFVHHHAPCLACPACRRGEHVQCATWRATQLVPGGLAEYFLVKPENQRDTLKLPDSVSDLDGVLVEPAACVVKSLRRAALKPGESILVLGLGIMGMMHLRLARHLGAGLIVGADLLEERAQKAQPMGADYGLAASGDALLEQMRTLTGGAGADVVIVGPGTIEALKLGIDAAGRGATVVQFTATAPGLELSLRPHDLYFSEVRLVPSYSAGPQETRAALELIEGGVLSAASLITHRFPLEQVNEAFAMVARPQALKVAVTFSAPARSSG